MRMLQRVVGRLLRVRGLMRNIPARIVLLLLFGTVTSCTTTRWSVTEQYAVSPRQTPEILERTEKLIPTVMPSVNRPVLRLEPFVIETRQYTQQIKVERSVQSYEMRPFFSAVALSGATFALVMAHTGLIFSPTTDQRLMLNISAATLGLMSLTHLKPVGEPIPTGESRYLRESGYEVVTDTLKLSATQVPQGRTAGVQVVLNDRVLLLDEAVPLQDGAIEINLSAFYREFSERYRLDDRAEVEVVYGEGVTRSSIPVRQFMETYVEVDQDLAELWSEPVMEKQYEITEIARGSSLPVMLGGGMNTLDGGDVSATMDGATDLDDRWLRVRYGAREAYMLADRGFFKWFSDFADEAPLVLELRDIPYGEVDIEQSIPVLRSAREGDEALIITNIYENQAGSRQFLQRSHRLFEDYMTTAFRMDPEQVTTLEPNRLNASTQFECVRGKGRMMVYLSGFSTLRQDASASTLSMYAIQDNGEESFVRIQTLLNQLLACQKEEILVFVDLDAVELNEDGQVQMQQVQSVAALRTLATSFVDRAPNSAVFFANLPGQTSSLYSGTGLDDKRHTIFMYFIAEGWKKRLRTVADLERHLSSNVDYTARRLHDRPQEVSVFGNRALRFTDR